MRALWLAGVVALIAAGCSSAGSEAATTTVAPTSELLTTTTTAPPREPSTTTTAFDPASVEGAVEAAYLKSWDVYADAVYNLELDEPALAEVHARDALGLRIDEIRRRIADRQASLVAVDHSYQIAFDSSTTANVIDHLTNHQILIDADTKEPIEEDPDDRLLLNFRLELIDDSWRVTFIQKVSA